MEEIPRRERSPGIKLLLVALVGAVLTIPLLLVFAMVYDRQDQASTAQTEINAGWGGPQVVRDRCWSCRSAPPRPRTRK